MAVHDRRSELIAVRVGRPGDMRARLIPVIAVICLAFGCPRVCADGKFFSRMKVADEPGIQAQRGVVVFRDGIETLILQSDVSGTGDEFGWIVPLPAQPSAIEPVDPVVFHCLDYHFQPVVVSTIPEFLSASAILLVLVTLFALYAADRTGARQRMRGGFCALVVLLVIVASTIMLPSLSTKSVSVARVEVLQRLQAGVYDVQVIRAKSADAILGWLSTNGFQAPSDVKPVMDAYIKEDWCFAAAKLRRSDPGGTIAHHPLAFTFPSPRAVYPLRLTGVGAEPLQLDVFVIGDRSATADRMEAWTTQWMLESSARKIDPFAAETRPVFRAANGSAYAAGEGLVERMWDQCMLTRLRGRLSAADMREDLVIEWGPQESFRKKVHSTGGALSLSGTAAMVVFLLVLFVASLSALLRTSDPLLRIRRVILPGLAVALLGGGIVFASLEVVSAERRRGPEFRRSYVATGAHHDALRSLEAQPSEAPFPQAYREAYEAELLKKELSPPRAERLTSPGEYRIDPRDDGWTLTYVDRHYIPLDIFISSNGQPVLPE